MRCPTEEQLSDFVAGRLAEASRREVEHHASECEQCAAVLTMFASTFVPDAPEPTLSGEASSPGSEELRPGDRIGRFVVLGEVGRGGMGVVYAAYDDALDRRVALKVLASGRADAASQRVLHDEARAMAQLVHPNVVTVLDVGVEQRDRDERLFIAMEFVEGGTLRTWLRSEPPVEAILTVLVDAARGLAAAHRAGFIHRDFKPDNVLVDPTGHARVTDFGLARTVDSEAERRAVVGTPLYMAPEQFEGRDAGPASDVFGWSVTAWEALYGERPFAEPPRRDRTGRPERAPQAPTGRRIEPKLHAALLRGLAAEPDERWPSMDALLEAIAASRRPRRVMGLSLGIAGVGGLALLVGLVLRGETQVEVPVCLDPQRQRATTWPPERRLAFEARYAAQGSSAIQGVDDYVDDWTVAMERHCEASRDQSKTSAEIALGAECLRLRGRELGDAVAHAMVGEPLEEPGRLFSALSPPGDCNEPSRYLVAEYRYATPEQREATLQVEDLLSQAWSASLRGDMVQAEQLARDAVEEARRGERNVASARALLELAKYQDELGDKGAPATVARALRHATLAGDHGLAFQTVLERMDALKERGDGSDEEMVWLAELARTHAAADPEGPSPRKEREVLWRLGYAAWRHGDVRGASRTWDDMRALELSDRSGSDDFVDGLTSSLLAVSQGRWSAASRSWQAADEAARRSAPTGSARLQTLHNAAFSTCELGDVARARSMYAEADALAELRYGGPNPVWLDLHIAQARCELNLGFVEQAREALERAKAFALELALTPSQRRRLTLLEVRLDPEASRHDATFEVLRDGTQAFGLEQEEDVVEFEWGMSLLARAEPLEAREHLERAFARSVQRIGPGQPQTLARQAWLGVAAARCGDRQAAREHLDRALEGLLRVHEGHVPAIVQALEARAALTPDSGAEDRRRAQELVRTWGLAGRTSL